MLASLLVPSLLLAWVSSAAAKPVCKTCDVKGLEIVGLPSSVQQPSHPLTAVSVAIGTQNYTCSEHGNYTATGAVATLYDISCLGHSHSHAFLNIQDLVFKKWKHAPAHAKPKEVMAPYAHVLGEQGDHYFIPNPVTGQGVSPKWDFTTTGPTAGDANAFVTVTRLGGAKAPTGPQDVDWLALSAVEGGLAKEVYRTDTREGQPPAGKCHPGSGEITVKYASKYWFYGSELKEKGKKYKH